MMDARSTPLPNGIRRAGADDVSNLHEVAWASFESQVAPHYTEAGVAEYRRFCSPEAIEERMSLGHHFWLVEAPQGATVAMAEVRAGHHLAMLFVQPGHCEHGTGSRLLDRLASEASEPLTVNASVNALGFYSKRGFEATGPERDEKGIRFVPMRAR
ncbi:MAG: GNAT superfamily N-acetyltransferase [Chlamydiales bacterium]|jgi:GNAT superfamily N-acetyltransferase